MTELSDPIDVWSYRSFRILIYVDWGQYNGNLDGPGSFGIGYGVDSGCCGERWGVGCDCGKILHVSKKWIIVNLRSAS